jgi:hypothetical protein
MSDHEPVGISQYQAASEALPAPGPRILARAYAASAATTAGLLLRHRLRLPSEHVGLHLRFADGESTSRVYRETVKVGGEPTEPTLLVVSFRLRLLGRNRFLHALFRAESILNTPLFAGFAGFRSKLWITDLRTGLYRGVYQWDDPVTARGYAAAITALLRLLSEPGTVRAHIDAGVRRDEYLRDPGRLPAGPRDGWWVLRCAS